MLGGLVVSLLAIVGTVAFANSILQKNSQKLLTVKTDSKVAEEREKYYLQAKKELEKYQDLSTTLEKVLPKDKDEARAVAELYKIGQETGIEITRIAFPTSTLGQKAGSKATAGAKTPAVTQAKPVDGLPGVLAINTSVELAGSQGENVRYSQILDFLKKIERNRRNMQISQITITPDPKTNELKVTIGLNIFVKP